MMNLTPGRKAFLILAFLTPLLYLSMYLPLWNGKELKISGVLAAVLAGVQVLSLILAAVRLFSKKCRRYALVFDAVAVLSVLLTAFYGFIFLLELFHIPWFPPQN